MITPYFDGCTPFVNTDIVCPDMSFFKICSAPLVNTINAILKMLDEEKVDSYYSLNGSNITNREEVFFNLITDKNIKDHLDIAMMKDNMRFIYYPDEFIGSYLFRFSSYSTVNTDEVNNFATFLIGKRCRHSEEDSMKLCIDIITYKMHLELKKLGVPFSRIPAENSRFDNDVIALSDLTSLSDAKFIIDYYVCLFKTLDSCLDLKYGDFEKVENALFLGYDTDIYNADFESLQSIYNYAIETDSTSDEYKELLKKVFNDII